MPPDLNPINEPKTVKNPVILDLTSLIFKSNSKKIYLMPILIQHLLEFILILFILFNFKLVQFFMPAAQLIN